MNTTKEIILEITHSEDLTRLIEFLKQSGISYRQRSTKSKASVVSSKPLRTLGSFIGTAPQLQVDDFEAYLKATRSEWENDTY